VSNGKYARAGSPGEVIRELLRSRERAAADIYVPDIDHTGAVEGDVATWDDSLKLWVPRATYAVAVPLGSTGWKYHQTTLGDAADYSSPSFDDSAWSTGQGPFGNGVGPTAVNTAWTINTRMWLRREIPHATAFSVSGLVDNNVDIYWNGTLIGSAIGADNGTAAFGPFIVPSSAITSGVQVLAVNAVDDAAVLSGDVSLIDVSVQSGLATVGGIPGTGGLSGFARVSNPTAQSIPNATWTPLTFSAEDSDARGYHSLTANTDRLTIPAGFGGPHVIGGHAYFSNASGVGSRMGRFLLNGVTEIGQSPIVAGNAVQGNHIPGIGAWDLDTGDWVIWEVYQDSGAALNVSSHAFWLKS
jgi:hypothetical protein